jgi:hypothetical protein
MVMSTGIPVFESTTQGAEMSGKSPRNSKNLKQGRSIKEKRADKKAKATAEQFLPRRRKDAL